MQCMVAITYVEQPPPVMPLVKHMNPGISAACPHLLLGHCPHQLTHFLGQPLLQSRVKKHHYKCCISSGPKLLNRK